MTPMRPTHWCIQPICSSNALGAVFRSAVSPMHWPSCESRRLGGGLHRRRRRAAGT
jgi:hypothetical protein